MSFLVSTTTTDVMLADLGILLPHPTDDFDLSEYILPEQISGSHYVTDAIQSGLLTLKLVSSVYGTYSVDALEYYPGLAIQNSAVKEEEELYITESELGAGYLDSVLNPSPLSVTSTASSTKNIYCNLGLFQKWKVNYGDKVVIVGGTAAGVYTVDQVIDQYQLKVLETISSSSGTGTLNIYHPPATTRIGVNNTNLTTISGINLQEVLENIDSALGQTSLTGHNTLRDLIHFIDEGPASGFTSGAYKEITGQPFPTSEIWWTSAAKTEKIVELIITRNSNKTPATEVWKMYDTDGITVLATITDTYSYSGIFETSKTRTIA